MATHVDTSGRGDNFSATAHCSACGWSREFRLDDTDTGSFEVVVLQAEAAASEHAARAARLAQDAFDTDEDRFGPQDA